MTVGRADVHIHTTYSDGLLEPEDAVNYAVTQTNLRLIAITGHNTLDGAHHAYDYWHSHHDAFSQIEVIIGEEISSTHGHILGLFLHEAIPPHLSPADTVTAIHDDLTNVNFVDSAGMGYDRRSPKAGQGAEWRRLAGASEGVALSLRLVRLDRMLQMYQTAAEALAAHRPHKALR